MKKDRQAMPYLIFFQFFLLESFHESLFLFFIAFFHLYDKIAYV